MLSRANHTACIATQERVLVQRLVSPARSVGSPRFWIGSSAAKRWRCSYEMLPLVYSTAYVLGAVGCPGFALIVAQCEGAFWCYTVLSTDVEPHVLNHCSAGATARSRRGLHTNAMLVWRGQFGHGWSERSVGFVGARCRMGGAHSTRGARVQVWASP